MGLVSILTAYLMGDLEEAEAAKQAAATLAELKADLAALGVGMQVSVDVVPPQKGEDE